MTSLKKTIQYLAVSALGVDQPGIANEICKLAAHCNCNIIDSKITTLGSEFSASLLLTGTWNAIAKFENSITVLEKKHDMRIICRHTQQRAIQPNYLPYSVYIIAADQSTVVHRITDFFAELAINIHDLYVTTYTAPYCETQMLAISLSITIPKAQLLADLRESLMLFCDDHNFDVVLEPQKS